MSGRSFSHHCSLGILCLRTGGSGRRGGGAEAAWGDGAVLLTYVEPFCVSRNPALFLKRVFPQGC